MHQSESCFCLQKVGLECQRVASQASSLSSVSSATAQKALSPWDLLCCDLALLTFSVCKLSCFTSDLEKNLESLSHWKARVRQCDTQSVQHHYLGIWPAGWVPKALKHGRFLHPNAGRCQRICMNVCGKGMVTYETSNRSLASACKKGAFNNWPTVSPWDLLYCDVGLLAF